MNMLAAAPDAWRAFPDTYAERRSEGRWTPYRHLRVLADVVHDAILRGDGRVIVSMPPRHGKSEFCSYWLPSWYLDLYPERRVILTSYGAELATGFSRRVRDNLRHLGTNDIDAEPLTQLSDSSTASHRFDTTEGGGMIAAGVGGPITGRGGQLLIIDDPVKNWEEAQSPTVRRKVVDWYRSTFYTRAEPGSTVVIIMTRWHEEDLAGFLEADGADDWRIVRMDAIHEPREDEPPDPIGREPGDPLCPERYDLDALARFRRNSGPVIWSALYQQRPAPADGEVFRRDWFRICDRLPDAFDELIQSWDMTFGSKSATASYVVGAVWGRRESKYYRLDEERGRWSFPETKDAVRRLTARWPGAHVKLVEKKANGAAIIEELDEEVGGFVEVEPDGSKYARAVAASPAFEGGDVLLLRGVPWLEDYIVEMCQFPNGANDDRVDETAQAVRRFRGGGSGVAWWV